MSDSAPTGAPGTEPARATPFELAFDEAGIADRLFPALQAGVEQARVNPSSRSELVLVSEMTELVREMVPPEAPPEAMEQHRAMLFHAFNFWRHGKRLFLFEPAVARFLVESNLATAEWEFAAPHPSCYLQLPANLFWGSIAQDSPAEPIDGFFITVDSARPEVQILEALMVLGIRRNRAGFSIIPFETEVGPGIESEWADAPSREEGRDFETVLPGGDLAGLYSVVTAGEALKLMYRMLWYLDEFSDQLLPETAVERKGNDRPDSPPASRLKYRRVLLGGPGAGDTGA
jgi:hypothetical protein